MDCYCRYRPRQYILSHSPHTLLSTKFKLNQPHPETEFLDEIQTKLFLFAIHSHLYSFALRFLFLQAHATSYII